MALGYRDPSMTNVPTLADDDCQVWWARPADAHPRLATLLNPVEHTRAAAYKRQIDRDRFIVGCALSRLVLGELLDLSPARVPLERPCADCGRPHGRPQVAGRPEQLSISHSGDRVALAVTRSGPVGIDVEQIDARKAEAIESVLTAEERGTLAGLSSQARLAGLYTYWVRKEAVLKATGHGLTVPMREVGLSRHDEPAAVRFDRARQMVLADLSQDGPYRCAVAVGAVSLPNIVELSGAGLLARH